MRHIGKIITAVVVSALIGLSAYSLYPAQREVADKIDNYTRIIEEELTNDVVCGGGYKLTDVERASTITGMMKTVELYHRLKFTSSRGSVLYVDMQSHVYTSEGRVYAQTSLSNERFVAAQLVKNAFYECLGGKK